MSSRSVLATEASSILTFVNLMIPTNYKNIVPKDILLQWFNELSEIYDDPYPIIENIKLRIIDYESVNL